jgi:hypothetical protein
MTIRLALTRSAMSTSSSDASWPLTCWSISNTQPELSSFARTSASASSEANRLSISESPREVLTTCSGS